MSGHRYLSWLTGNIHHNYYNDGFISTPVYLSSVSPWGNQPLFIYLFFGRGGGYTLQNIEATVVFMDGYVLP